jgi:hypothetical protein
MTTSLALAWHITKKDLRSLQSEIILWVVLTVAHVMFRTVWPPLTMSLDANLVEWVNMAGSVLPAARGITFVLIATRLVHADPLVTADAFWLTRPIPPRLLFASKLATMLLVLALPAGLAQAVPMIAYGVPPLDLTRLMTENLLYFAAGLMAPVAAAALTSNLRSLSTLVLALAVLWAGASILATTAFVGPTSAQGPNTARVSNRTARQFGGASATQRAVSLVLIAGGFGAAAWHQYRTRRSRQSALIAAATLVALFITPYSFAQPRRDASIPSFTDNPAVPLGTGMRFQDGARSVVMWPLGDRVGQCGVLVRMTQTLGLRQAFPSPWQSYRFVHRPTGRGLVFTYFALPDRIREFAPSTQVLGSEALEPFQVFYRYAVVGPLFTSDDPLDTEVRSLQCRDVGVIVRH